MHQPTLAHTFADALPDMAVPLPGTQVPGAELIVLNAPLARELGLDPDWLRSPEGVAWLAGSAGGHATAYSGHQFGQFVPVLGDGRALLLGDIGGREIQLKGSGLTPFSRPGSDGLGAIGPMLREYLISEFMHAIGIPTTRSLAVLRTGETVVRQQGPVPAGIVVRVATSHLRVGSLQYAAQQSRDLVGDVIAAAGFDGPAELLDTVIDRQIDLVNRWMRVGFVHGVMNTDNVALSGETIDYGPCAFTQRFDGAASFSSIDAQGRYAFGNQPGILAWNMVRLAETLLPELGQEQAQEILSTLQTRWDGAWGRYVGAHAEGLVLAEDITAYNREHGMPFGGTDPNEDDTYPGPIYIPRNHMLDAAITAAERDGDVAAYLALLQAVTHPYDEAAGEEWMAQPEKPGPFRTFCGT
ncbi:protein adenylyltransferase SelO family protein [Corynebacterium gottingense]|uniref:protein adenylyltransferase SelO family protein n=1 Tax=Corynebacterium gottingense TaxID=2041036 RepID=UPI0038D04536